MTNCKECCEPLSKREEALGLETCIGCIHYEVNGSNRITDRED